MPPRPPLPGCRLVFSYHRNVSGLATVSDQRNIHLLEQVTQSSLKPAFHLKLRSGVTSPAAIVLLSDLRHIFILSLCHLWQKAYPCPSSCACDAIRRIRTKCTTLSIRVKEPHYVQAPSNPISPRQPVKEVSCQRSVDVVSQERHHQARGSDLSISKFAVCTLFPLPLFLSHALLHVLIGSTLNSTLSFYSRRYGGPAASSLGAAPTIADSIATGPVKQSIPLRECQSKSMKAHTGSDGI